MGSGHIYLPITVRNASGGAFEGHNLGFRLLDRYAHGPLHLCPKSTRREMV